LLQLRQPPITQRFPSCSHHGPWYSPEGRWWGQCLAIHLGMLFFKPTMPTCSTKWTKDQSLPPGKPRPWILRTLVIVPPERTCFCTIYVYGGWLKWEYPNSSKVCPF
jgi:hypothetical protein